MSDLLDSGLGRKRKMLFKAMKAWYLFAAVTMLLTGCSTLAYYSQAVQGHLDLMGRRNDIAKLLSDPDTPTALKQQLKLIREMRVFASRELLLPDNKSYLSYADLEREAMVWNLVATPEFSLKPKQWCYPLIGCASYRGYFSETKAERAADSLRLQGMDAVVQPIPAYSSLGWFDDPIPSTVIRWPAPRLAEFIFHELAHQRIYVRDDTAFNEAFAGAVQKTGVDRWLRAERSREEAKNWRLFSDRRQQFLDLLLSARQQLLVLYQSEADAQAMRKRKAAAFRRLRLDYETLKAKWYGYSGFDRWFEQAPLNNARLASVATYNRLLPALLALLEHERGNLDVFFRACEQLAELPVEKRQQRLLSLLD